MAVGPIGLVAGVVLAGSALTASTLTAPASAAPRPAQAVPCAEPAAWETDAQRLADALDGVTGDADADRLRQRLEAAGFVPGGGAPPGSAERDLADLVTGLLAALTGGTPRNVQVVVIGPDGEPVEVGRTGTADECIPGGS